MFKLTYHSLHVNRQLKCMLMILLLDFMTAEPMSRDSVVNAEELATFSSSQTDSSLRASHSTFSETLNGITASPPIQAGTLRTATQVSSQNASALMEPTNTIPNGTSLFQG